MWSFVLVTVVVILQVGAEEVVSPPDDYAIIPDTSKQEGSQGGLPETLEPPAKPLMIMILGQPTKVNPPEVLPDKSEKNSLEDTKNTKTELPLLLIKLTENLKKPTLPDMTKEEEKPIATTVSREKRTTCLNCGGGHHKHGSGGYGGAGCGSGGCGGGRRGGCGYGGCGESGGDCGSAGCGRQGSYNSGSSSKSSSSSSAQASTWGGGRY